LALALALASAGNNNAAKIAMIAITTNNSINVNPVLLFIKQNAWVIRTPWN
jgi:hypothetical protein